MIGCNKEELTEQKIKMYAQNISADKLTIIIENNTEEDITLKPGMKLKKLENNKWIELKGNNCSTLGYGIDKNGMMDLEIDLKCEYGTLTKGKYDLIKYLEDGTYINTQFEI